MGATGKASNWHCYDSKGLRALWDMWTCGNNSSGKLNRQAQMCDHPWATEATQKRIRFSYWT